MERLVPLLARQSPAVLFSTGAVTAITFVWILGRIFGPPSRKWSRAINQGKPGKEGPTHRHIMCEELLDRPEFDPSVSTLYELALAAAKRFPSNYYQGARPLIQMHEEQKEGDKKEIKKWTFYELGHYKWETYSDFVRHAKDIGAGLVAAKAVPGKTHIGIFCLTRPEWLQVAHAAFTQSMSVATVYANLGEEGLVFAIQECGIEILFTSADLLATVNKICKSCPTLKTVVFCDEDPKAATTCPTLKTIQLNELEKLGQQNPVPPTPPKPADTAVIMYTSGSTGAPKGVIIKHRNLIAAAAGAAKNVNWIRSDDVYLAFLPLAHVLELMVENAIMSFGAAMGYGSIRTISDANVRNCKSDIGELRPTVMAGVPTVWEMIRKSALAKVEASGPVSRAIFSIALKVNIAYVHNEGIPIVHFLLAQFFNAIVFRKFRALVGGRLRAMVAGGAPLSSETQRFMRACMGVPFLQGYGLTESCGMCAIQPYDHRPDKCVGAIMGCCEVKLVDAPEMGYSSSNSPQRGEIWIRGPAIADGYYKNKEKTEESFKDGWLATGDVGEWAADGTLAVIDRIKNLVKLAHGEYIALEKLESVYKDCPFVQNICVYADGERDFPIALVFPFAKAVTNWAERTGQKGNFHELCESPKLEAAILASLQDAAKAGKLKGIEQVQRVIVTGEEWTPENDMLTAAMKLKRANIVAKFKPRIAEVYKSKK